MEINYRRRTARHDGIGRADRFAEIDRSGSVVGHIKLILGKGSPLDIYVAFAHFDAVTVNRAFDHGVALEYYIAVQFRSPLRKYGAVNQIVFKKYVGSVDADFF